MPDYTITLTEEQDEVLEWEADKHSLIPADFVQSVADKMLAERAGHFHDPREVLKRLTNAEIANMAPNVRKKLGLG